MNEDKLSKITSAIQGEIDAFSEVMDVSKFRELQKQLEKFLTTDPVTGALNRWKIEDVVKTEIGRAQSSKGKMCLLMIDIDKFKRINDILGHNMGDHILKHVAYNIEYAFDGKPNKSQHFGRWGGDEFVYVLSSKNVKDVKKTAVKALREVETISSYYDLNAPISVSIGVAWLRKGETADGLVARADKAMYKAKKKGGNRVEMVQ